jgi:RND family efflux transporter MFP subunit
MMVKKRKRFPWGWVVVGLLVAGGGGYGYWQYTNASKSAQLPTGVQIGTAKRGEISQQITATGVVAAQVGAKANIGSQISGRVSTLPADVGAQVRAGQVVATIDAPDLQAQVEQQRQSVSVAQSTLDGAESRLNQARLNVELSEEQTRTQIAEAEAARRAAQQRLKVAQATTELEPTQTRSEIERAEAALSTARSTENQVKQTVNLQLLQAKTSVDEARAAATNTQKIVRRQEGLLGQGFISRQEVDDSRTTLEQTRARLASAQANANIVKEKTAADLQAARDQVAQAEAALRMAKANTLQGTMRTAEEQSAREAIRQAEATLQLRKSNKTQDLIRKRGVEEARAAVLQARASLKQAKAALQYQVAQLDKAIIRSPLTGTVLTVTTQQGETVAAGFQVQTLITVADLRRLEVRAYIDEVDIGKTRLGLPAEVRVESYPNRVFNGRVTKIASASTVKDNVVTYETTIALENTGGLLRPDMTADVTLVLGRRPDVLLVPTEAVHREVKRSVVYVLHKEKQGKERVETREVTTGVQDGSSTQILTGLKEGEEVVLAGLQRLGVKASDAQDAEGKKEE